jgi:S1-C subfamily serine protease
MFRTCLVFALTALVGSWVCELRADDHNALANALALEETVQKAIQKAEPSIACVIVSRSDVYRAFEQQPPSDNPGQLGPFDPGRVRIMRGVHPLTYADEQTIKKYDLANPDNVPEAYGSGVVLDGEGLLILTNYHVVRDAAKIYVRLPGGKGSYADIHAADPRSDLAVLRLLREKLRPLPELKFGDGGSARKGQFVLSLANPFAAGFRDGSPSASWGILSNIQRRAAGSPEEDRQSALHIHPILFQTDARLNLGCSGGALLNLRGELIGLTTSRAAINGSETAGGFAIPLDANVQRIIGRLREGREVEYGFLGVRPDLQVPNSEGVRIREVTHGSPAQKAGLIPGDAIVSINGIRVHDFEDLVLTVGTLMAGTKVELEVPNHSPRLVSVTLAKYYIPEKVIASQRPPAVRGMRVDYTSVLMQRLSSVRQRGHIPIHPGVFVRELQPGSPAAARLRLDDIITHVRVQNVEIPINTPDEFYREASKIGSRQPLWLTLEHSAEPVRID